MPPEAIITLAGAAAAILGGLAYVIRKWADSKEKQLSHEVELQKLRVQHELEMEKKKEMREEARQGRDMETASFISSSTETMRGLAKAIEEQTKTIAELRRSFEHEITGGLTLAVRENTERMSRMEIKNNEKLEQIEQVVKEIRMAVGLKK